MSSILAFLAAAVVKVIPFDAEAARLKAEIDDLKRENERLAEERDRWMALSDRWQQRYEAMTQSQGQMAMSQYTQNVANQYAQMQDGRYQAMLGQQQFDPGVFCNCVPARHDLLLSGN